MVSAQVEAATDVGVRALSFGLSGTTAGLWWATAAIYGFAGVAFAVTYGLWRSYVAGDTAPVDVLNLEGGSFALSGYAILATWATGILFIVWFFQAYKSAESRGAAGRSWGAGWTIGSWFIPLADLVLPKLVMNEVDRMSNPLTGPAPIETYWKAMRRLGISDLWWLLLVIGVPAFWVGSILLGDAALDAPEVGAGYLVLALSDLVLCGAAALLGAVVLTIGRRLRDPR
jgi:Domain of unknown function (DUF4328)